MITDHDTGRLVWAGKNRTAETWGRFFDDLGRERAGALTTSPSTGRSGSTPWQAAGSECRAVPGRGLPLAGRRAVSRPAIPTLTILVESRSTVGE